MNASDRWRALSTVATRDFTVVAAGSGIPRRGTAVIVAEDGEVGGVSVDGRTEPAVVVSGRTTVADVMENPFLVHAFEDGALGLVVLDAHGKPVGFVPVTALPVRRKPDTLGDSDALTGRSVPIEPIRVICAVCGKVNRLAAFSHRRKRRCRHGDHVLEPYYPAGDG